MLTPCPHCDQQVIPDGDGACPLCGGAVLDANSPPEPPQPAEAAVDDSPTECGNLDDIAEQEDIAEETAETQAAAAACPAAPAAASSGEPPVWGQVDDDLVAPEGLVGDDDDEEEDDVAEADDDEASPSSAGPGEHEAPPAPQCAAAVVPELRLPCLLLGAVLAVQIAVSVWSKLEPHAAALAPVFGFAVMLILGVGALYALGRGATDKVGLRPFTAFQFLLLLFAAAPASILAAQAGNLILHLTDIQAFPSWLRPPVPDELPHLALAIAGLCVVPALAQELVFRGVIGRAFIARFGPLNGMLLTCAAFAACAVFPEWIAKAFVLAVMFQLVFAATRSLAAAIVLNALCAATSIVIQRFPDALSIPGFTHPHVSALVAWELLAGSGAVLAAVVASLYLTRTRYLTAEGKPWTPGYCSLERPPTDTSARLHSPDAHGGLVIVVVAIFAGFIVLLFWEGQRGAVVVDAYNRNKVPIPPPPPPPSPPPGGGMPGGPMMPGPGGMGPGGPGGKGVPGGGKFKAKKGKAAQGAGQQPLAEDGGKASERPRRPEGADGVVPKPAVEDRIPSDNNPPKRFESAPPKSLSADPPPADSSPPAREPARQE